MNQKKKNILITGYPGVGKTTLIRKLHDALKDKNPAGFYTTEIRENGVRKGFELVGLDGRKGILSHVNIRSGARVGKYGVDVDAFDAFLDTVDFYDPSCSIIIIDEIGKMECFSSKFKRLIVDLLNSDKTVIAVIARKGGGLIEDIKRRPDTTIFEITPKNRDSLLSETVTYLAY